MVTASINVLNKNNTPTRCRTLLDTSSTSNLMTERLAKDLGLLRQQFSISITGLGNIQTSTSDAVTTTIQSRYNRYEKTLQFFTVPEITRKHPTNPIDLQGLRIPSKIKLADPTFNIPSNIDMLIGAGPTLSTFLPGQKNLSLPQGPDLFLQNTYLGWVIGGTVNITPIKMRRLKRQPTTCHVTTIQALKLLTKTWEIEEGSKTKHWSKEEIQCEEHFKNNFQRQPDGKYMVALPFNSKKSLIGETRQRALNRYKTLTNKFAKQPEFYKQYASIIQEYLDLNHMEVADNNSSNTEGFYLPHHAVIKESSLTTKVRVVFDGSAKSSSGISLNEALMVGPTIQDVLFNHLIRFRLHVFVLTGDIQQMYRQIWLRPEDRKYQKILWKDETGEIKDYQLKTVTFGIASAPFLAIRSLHQLADDEMQDYPRAAKIIKRDMYVDDLLTGAGTFEEALEIRNEIIEIFKRGNLNIRQWASNEPLLLADLPENNINSKLQIESNPLLKTLGIHWQSKSDTINYTLNDLPTDATMRIVLAEIAKIFDPLGLLGPIIIAARLILQECWRHELTWDQQLPVNIQEAWSKYSQEFNDIKTITFQRNIVPKETHNIQLHGFSDASENAYGACIYLRCTTKSGDIHTQLLCAKSKVAPLKNVTLARLELCAALMLVNLYNEIKEHSQLIITKATFWSDSTIVLHWINTPTYQLKTFVANRVAEIQRNTSVSSWRHVRTDDNPADALSRGQSPKKFLTNNLWTVGVPWLKQEESKWPTSSIPYSREDNEERKLLCFTTCITPRLLNDTFIRNFSTLSHLHRAIALILRWRKHNSFRGQYTPEEIHQAQIRLIKLIQTIAFQQEIHHLKHNKNVQETSKLKQLSPFLDKDDILRVGGRLSHANISYDQQHPIILPQSHHYTYLIILDAHHKNFHPGTQTTLYAVRRRFWPLNGRNETRRIIHKCVRCIRFKPHTITYPMGDLPKERVTQTRPFYHTGVDYCGPFYIKEKKFRNRIKCKIYVAVFVCLAIKAVHLEVVSDLTTEGFIAALKRFIARRGKCRTIHSDNGTNFIGANNQLKEIYQQINSIEHQTKVQGFLTEESIEWRFIPARSPNFGGLWEAAVKSYKHHMTRVIGDSLLTFEEFNTFVIEIESILNSRPITPNSSDPNDPIAITPGHFLIGDSLTSIPEWDWSETSSNRLSSWQNLQKIKQTFWKRWHKDYLNGLNIRHKWAKGSYNIQKGALVIIKDDNTRPLQWPIGRVLQVHPGADGVIRTVTVKTSTGLIERNVRHLAILLPDQEEDQSS